jgi:hypothetical protein
LTKANETLTAALNEAKANGAEALASEREKNVLLTTANKKLIADNEQLIEELTEAQRKAEKTAALETALAEKTAELEALQAEIEKLRADLVYQNKAERIAYAHTNTFFIMEEKMGRFYRDAMCASESKIGI